MSTKKGFLLKQGRKHKRSQLGNMQMCSGLNESSEVKQDVGSRTTS